MRNAADEALLIISTHPQFGVAMVLNNLTGNAPLAAKNKMAGNKLTIGKYAVLNKILKNADF